MTLSTSPTPRIYPVAHAYALPEGQTHIRSTLTAMFRPGAVVELRALGADGIPERVASGYFNDMEALSDAAAKLDDLATGVYVTLNPVNPTLLARARNRVRVKPPAATSDGEIERRTHLLIDCDPQREAGTSASQAEKDKAHQCAKAVWAYLCDKEWPDPTIYADSGNGAHLIYDVDLPADDGGLTQRVLSTLAKEFDTELIKIDKGVHNPSRISKLYGTMARKGNSTQDRPHRRSQIIEKPESAATVSREMLEAVAGPAADPPRKVIDIHRNTRPAGEMFEVEPYLIEHGVGFTSPVDYKGGRKWKLDACVWNGHTDHAAVVWQEPGGMICANCSHNSCEGLGWIDLREQFEPGYRAEKEAKERAYQERQPGPRALRPTIDGGEGEAAPEAAPPLTDMGNGERFAAQHRGAIVWVPEHNQWFAFDGGRWCEGDGTDTYALAKETIRGIAAEAQPKMTDDERKAIRKWSKVSESARGVNAMFSCAKQERGIAATLEQFDANPWLLNVANGTIDLHSGERRGHDATDRQKKIAPVAYDPAAQCPLWIQTIETIFAGDKNLVRLLKRAFGYTLTGNTREQKLFLLHGDGENGKSTILNVLGEILGEYGGATDMKLLTTARGVDSTKSYHFAALAGSRFISAVEPGESAHLDEATIKLLTGTDRVPARFPYGRPFSFMPEFKLWLSFNNRPEIKGTDNGIWRRPVLIPFGVRFTSDGADGTPRKDTQLAEKLRAEYPGILAWAVQGCLDWQRDGLEVPEVAQIALNEYREDMDDFGAFLHDCCEDVPGYIESTSELYKVYESWCYQGGVRAKMSATKFGRTLGERKKEPARMPDGARARIGIRIKTRTSF